LIRQARTYLLGAVSGTALIGAAVVAFVLLVSAQALRDWPIAGLELGGSGEASTTVPETGAAAPAPTDAAAADAAPAAAGSPASGDSGGEGESAGGPRVATQGLPTTGAGDGTPGAPAAPVDRATPGSPPSDGDAPPPDSTASQNPSGAGSDGGKSASSAGDDAGSGPSTSGAVAGTVNDTVSGVDGALGGTLEKTGVTDVTEDAVNEVAGPDSTVGKTVDKAVETVGGLLGGGR
jgi:hypothetical protein